MPLKPTLRYSTLFRSVLPTFFVILLIFSLVITHLVLTVYEKMMTCDREPHLTEDTMKGIVLQNEYLRLDLNRCRAENHKHFATTTEYLRRGTIQLIPNSNVRAVRSVADKMVINRNELFNVVSKSSRVTPYPGVEHYTRYSTARLGLSPLTGVDPLLPGFGVVINDVLSFRYPLMVAPCTDKPNINSRSVFIAVVSACENFDKRNTIRQTWKKHLDVVEREGLLEISGFAFVLGQPQSKVMQHEIREENNIHGDMIQIGMPDYYHNLPLKDAGLLNWLNRNCVAIDFLVKVDDDVYINVYNLAYFVQSYYMSSYNVFGVGESAMAWPHRDGKWAMTFEEWPWTHYPPYILGAIVLMTADSILPLLAACQTTPMIPYEDIYLYGICSKKAGIEIRYSARPNRALIGSLIRTPTTCELRTLLAWRPVSLNGVEEKEILQASHRMVDSFYRNASQCLEKSSIAANETYIVIDRTEPVYFTFK